uniref:SH3 domain-containing protein n=1 Tax=Syphacia muris TaxID=451379 RepID=A0A158R4J4_9BILA
MSRLRRSLSKNSIFGLSRSQVSLADLPSPAQNCLLTDRFSTPSTFPQLKHLVQANNEILREIISVFDERATLDFAYSKTMHKLSARLHKITLNACGVIDQGWSCVAEQFDAHATIHSNLGSAIADDIVQPLRAIFNSQHQTIKATEQLVERELRKLTEKRTSAAKTKRQLHSCSRDLEKVDQLIDNDKTSNIKLSVKKRKLLDQVIKLEQAYIEETLAAEKERRSTDNVLRRGVERLETVERQRLAHCQTALGRLQRKIMQFGPNLSLMFERHMNALNGAVNAELLDHIGSIIPTCSANHSVYLCDFHAENFGEVMGSDRRRWALERVSATLHDEADKVKAEVSEPVSSDVSNFTYAEFLEYLAFKVDESLKSIDGAQNQVHHRLSAYQQRTKDKMGLPQTILSIPLGERQMLAIKPPSLPTTSSTEDYEYEQIYSDPSIVQNRTPSIDASTPITNSDRPDVHENSKICRVLYDFNATSNDELDVRAGDCVIVESHLSPDWLVGHVISDLTDGSASKSGRFPASYVA